MRTATVIVAVAVLVLAVCQTAGAQTHAAWPADWNNWNDPALWCAVGDAGNAQDTRYGNGAVAYTYSIGKFEVTAGQYAAFLNAVAKTDAYGVYYINMGVTDYGPGIAQSGASGSYSYSVAPEYVSRPMDYLSWGNAARFCNWLTNGRPTGEQGLSTTEDGSYYLNGMTSNTALMTVTRKTPGQGGRYYIPTEDEWYKAAYHKGGSTDAGYWDYPTGSNTAPGRDLADASGNNANVYYLGGAYPIEPGHHTTLAGEFQNSHSSYGTFDQAGNIEEWTESAPAGIYRRLRGGSYGNIDYARAGMWIYDPPTSGHASNGLRIVEVPEPASAAFLVLGGLAVWRKPRK